MNLLSHLRFTIRHFVKQPAFTITAVLVLALGMGASTAVFSVLYQILLKPLPYSEPNRLVMIHNLFPKRQISADGVSGFDYASISAQKHVFSDAGIFYWNDMTLTGFGNARHLNVVNASASTFSTLEAKPQIGRIFLPSEDRAGATGTAVLSDGLWHSLFNGDPKVLGRSIKLNSLPYTVVGVMPAQFQFPSRETELWIPTALKPGETTLEGGRSEKWLHMLARLRPGVTVKQADASLKTISQQMNRTYAPFYPIQEGWHFTFKPLADEQTESVRRWLYLAFGAVLSVLLIACINVSGLFLIRGTARRGEFAVRRAMGAGKAKIVSQIISETGVLVLCGCGLALLIADWAVHFVNLYGPMSQPVFIQSWSFIFTLVLAVVSTVLVGIAPALMAADLPLEQTLRSSGSRTTTQTSALRYGIVAAQIAVAVALVFIASQLNRSFLNLTRVPVGFSPDHVWTGLLTLSNNNNFTANQGWNTQFFEPLFQQLKSLPGVEIASGANAVPFNPSGVWTEQLRIPTRPKFNPPPDAQISIAFPDYFAALGIPLLEGRTFTTRDRAGQAAVAVINQELARRYFGGEDALGKLIASGGANPAQIIGVVGDVQNGVLGGPSEPQIYFPALQERADTVYIVLRTSKDVDLTAVVRQMVGKLNASASLYDVETMPDRLADSLKMRRFIAMLLNGLAGIGLILAVVGLYGSLAHLVQLRQREIGIRLALGAMQSQVRRMIMIRGGMVVAAGMAGGVLGALLAEQTVKSQLFGVHVTDAAIWVEVLGAIGIASAVSAWIPAWRAAQIEPSEALRTE